MLTLSHLVEGELEAKGSRFLATLAPIATFSEVLAASRAAHPKANHHVVAARRMREDGQLDEQAKDDGEPSGTAGRPALQVLRGRELVDVGALVVRYFGGTKLGTGGLARAYAGAVAEALAKASPVPWVEVHEVWLRANFQHTAMLEGRVGADSALLVVERSFEARGVRLRVRGPRATLASLAEEFADATVP
ncbi:MAG: YigZ family protein [Pseudomonadota bacterium]